jgi:arylsulfatase A-like enzyme
VLDYVGDVIDERRFEVLEQTAGNPVYVSVLTPPLKPAGARGPEWNEMPALVLPPPASVAIDVRPEDGPVRLRAYAGVGRTSFAALPKGTGIAVDFEVDVAGRTVWSDRVRVARKRLHSNRWLSVGPSGGLALQPGDRVVLRTRCSGPPPPDGLRAGFGMLRMERTKPVPRAQSTPNLSNLVLLVVDTLRADRLGCYGYSKNTTPHIDHLARRGMLFEEAFATSSWTWPSTASILTGLAPEEHGVTHAGSCFLAPPFLTLPEALQLEGFTCGAFSANPLIVPQRGFGQGFELFNYDIGMRTGDELAPAALEWVRENAARRFFLYLHLADPHAPHRPRPDQLARLGDSQPGDFPSAEPGESKPAFVRYASRLEKEGFGPGGEPRWRDVIPASHARWFSDAYDASTASADYWIGALLAELGELGLLDRTVVAITSDHGEELLERGMLGHGHSLHRELVHVPLVLSGPGLPGGVRVATPVSHIHLATTLAGLMDVPFEPAGGGTARLDLSRAERIVQEPIRFSTVRGLWNGRSTPVLGLREGNLVLHWAPLGAPWGAQTVPEEGDWRLFDDARDRRQEHDASKEQPERAGELRTRLIEDQQHLLRSVDPAGGAGSWSMEMLRELGYVE